MSLQVRLIMLILAVAGIVGSYVHDNQPLIVLNSLLAGYWIGSALYDDEGWDRL